MSEISSLIRRQFLRNSTKVTYVFEIITSATVIHSKIIKTDITVNDSSEIILTADYTAQLAEYKFAFKEYKENSEQVCYI